MQNGARKIDARAFDRHEYESIIIMFMKMIEKMLGCEYPRASFENFD